MPIISVNLILENCRDNTKNKITLEQDNDNPIIVQRKEEYTLIIGLKRDNNTKFLKAHCPMFSKGKDESWFLVLGDVKNKELLALKRASGVNNQQKYHRLQFTISDQLGKFINLYNAFFRLFKIINMVIKNLLGPMKLTFYLVSDCYIGLDQQYSISLHVIS